MASGVIEKTNVDGGSDFCKLPDGTAIARGTVSFPSLSTVGSVTASVSFPMTFYAPPTVIMTWRDTNAVPNYCGALNARNITTSGYTADARYNQGGYGWMAAYIAVGRWK